MQIIKTGMLALAALAIAIAAASLAPAGAQGPKTPSWTGCSIKLAGGGSGAFARLSDGEGEIDSLGLRGWAARAGGDCNIHWLATGLVLGAGGDYTLQNTRFEVEDFSAKLRDSWTAYGRAGIARGSALYYLLGGYTKAKWSTNVEDLPTPDLEGWTAGAGIDVKLTDAWSIGGEYRFSRFDTARVGGIDLDTDQHSVMVTLTVTMGASR